MDEFIERRITTGFIISTEYVKRVRKVWHTKYLESKASIRIVNWCVTFYDEYGTAPGKDIEGIFLKESKKLNKLEAEDIADILESLSDEFEREDKFNVDYLYDQTFQYIQDRELTELMERVQVLRDKGNVVEAAKLIEEYKSPTIKSANNVDLSDEESLEDVRAAFNQTAQVVVQYPRQLGEFLNDSMVRGGFVSFMASEKRGKTWWLLDMAMRAARQRANVAFFQAGDMTKEQQIRRIGIHLAKKSDKKKYVGELFEPVRDCIWNQLDRCDRKERECDFGALDDVPEDFVRRVDIDFLTERLKDNPDYKPCHNCSKYWKNDWGAVWLKKIPPKNPLTGDEAVKHFEKFFVQNKRRLKISTHPNQSLTVGEAENILETWEKEDGFIADLIIFDYPAIMAPEIKAEFRHQENHKWQRLRGLSEKKHALVVVVDQADAGSYDVDTLSLKNFSEDKRKYGHVTAMYGLNQDKHGREKKIGIMRINEMLGREIDFSIGNQVYVLQNLKRGQPVLGSFFMKKFKE